MATQDRKTEVCRVKDLSYYVIKNECHSQDLNPDPSLILFCSSI